MARRRGEAPAVLAASAAQVRMVDEDERDLSRAAQAVGQSQAWQKGVLNWYDRGGEVFFGATWVGNSLSQILWNVGYGPQREPARGDDGNPREDVDTGLLAIAEEALTGLTGMSERQGDWARTTGELFSLIGETWLAGYWVDEKDDPVEQTDPAAYREVWEAVSPTVLTRKAPKKVYIQRKANDPGAGMELPGDHTLVHMWRRHPQYPDDPASPMRPLLTSGILELLDLLTKGLRGEALSRVHQGLLLWDARAVEQLTRKQVDASGAELPTKLVTELVAGLSTPKGDPGSASAIVPTTLTLELGSGNDRIPIDDAAKWLDISRDTTDSIVKVAEFCLKRLALGLDVPAEVLLGLGDTNHWVSWLLDENSYKQHLAALVDTLADCLTIGYLWPTFRAKNIDVERYRPFRVGADPTRLLRDPDLSAAADAAHDRLTISDASYRRAKGFDEDDTPDEAEWQRRAAIKAKPATTNDRGENVDPGPAQTPEPNRPRIVVTAATGPTPRDLGRMAARIEAAHLRDTLLLADRAVNDALKKAGARLRTKAQANPEVRMQLKGLDARLVGAHLGRARVFQLTAEEGERGIDSLFAESTDDMERSYASITKAAQGRWRRQVERTTGEDFTPEEDERMSQDAERSRGVLVAGVLAVAGARLLDPKAYAPQDGESPAGVNIPTAVARRASAAAGGASVAGGAEPMGRWEGGLTSGPTARDVATSRGLVETGLEWVYGDALRERPFEDHVDLDGLTFTSLDDPELEGAPWGSFYPGDHMGCLCTAAISYDITEDSEAAA